MQDVNAHSRQAAKGRGRRANSGRPYSSAVPRQARVASVSYATQGGPCQKAVDYLATKRPSALSAPGRAHIQHLGGTQRIPPRPPKRPADGKPENRPAAPINHISTNTVIIQINNQLVKLPQNQLEFVATPGGLSDTAPTSFQHLASAKSSEKNLKTTKYQRVNRKIRLKPGAQKAAVPGEQKRAPAGQSKADAGLLEERSTRLVGGEKSKTGSSSQPRESTDNSALLTRKFEGGSANQGIRESLPGLSSGQSREMGPPGSAVTIEALQASQRISIEGEVGRQYVATSQPEMRLKPVLDEPRAGVVENMVATPDVKASRAPDPKPSPILIRQTNLQSGYQLTHHIEVPALHEQALLSPTGISSIGMNPTSNQDSTYSFAADGNLGRVSGYQLDNLKEIVDQYEPPKR